MALTLEELLVQMHSRDLRCVAGFKGLRKEVIGFSVLDTPEILRWLKGGEILVSAGYVMRNNPSMIKSIVGDLCRKGCVGLGIKLQRYFDEIPKEIIEKGNEYDFPIFEIPYEIRFADLSKEIYLNIFRFDQTSLEKNNHIYQHLLKTVLSDAATEHMLYDISRSIHNPLILLNEDFKLLAYEASEQKGIVLSECMQMEYGKEFFDITTTEDLLKQQRQNRFVSLTIEKELGSRKIPFNIFPVYFCGQNEGFLVIPETVHPILTEQFELLDMIAPLIGIQLFRMRSEEGMKKGSSAFVNNVLINMNTTEEDIKFYCNETGFNCSLNRVCICLKAADYINLSYERRRSTDDTMFASLLNEAERMFLMHYLIKYEDKTFCFLFFEKNQKKQFIKQSICEFAKGVFQKMKDYKIETKIGISSVTTGLLGIGSAFRQSSEMINLGKKIIPDENIYDYERLQIYYMIERNMSLDQMKNIYQETIEVLDEYDKTHQSDLSYALEQYIENKFNVSKTAQKIHVHRNTLINKLVKVKEITDIDFDNSEQLVKYELGIRIKKIIQ